MKQTTDVTCEDLVDSRLAARWIAMHGVQAQTWLDSLPALVAGYAALWELQTEEPLRGGSVSTVLAVRLEGNPAVLKFAAPWARGAPAEAGAVGGGDGTAAPHLLPRA